MILLISVDQAKAQIEVVDDLRDDQIEEMIAAASEMVLAHMRLSTAPADWLAGSPLTNTYVPWRVQQAVKAVVGILYRDREHPEGIPEILTALLGLNPGLA